MHTRAARGADRGPGFVVMTPDEYCQAKAAQSGSSFYYSFLFLPAERRRAITALYAFCREVDDVADEASDIAIARTKLAWWRTELANLFAGLRNGGTVVECGSSYQLNGPFTRPPTSHAWAEA